MCIFEDFDDDDIILILVNSFQDYFAYPNRYVDLVHLFGLYEGELSSRFNRMVTHVFTTFGHLLEDFDT